MGKNTGKVREFCQPGKVGTLSMGNNRSILTQKYKFNSFNFYFM